ncbi:MAG: LysR family transcriptional regulator [Methylobacteriaceae bacterium]|nr:LysR family transcriptional regulator [Methylobacteriaceae bacterium]
MPEVNLRGLDLNLLVLLDSLLEHRNVTQAARAANISQPAMSRALGRLRATLKDPLLARGVAGLVPTPRALALQVQLRRTLAEIRDLVAPQAFDPAAWSGQVTLSATDHQTIMLLPELVARLARETPGLDLKVLPFTRDMLDELRDGRVQLSFGIAEQALPRGLRSAALFRDVFVTLMRRGHPAAADWTLARFVGLDHVLVTVMGDGRGALDDELDRLGMRRRLALRLPHFYAAMAVVARSDRVVTLPRTMAMRFAPGFDLVALPPPIERPPFTVTVIWPDALDSDPGIAWLRRIVVEEATRIEGTIPLAADA